MNEAQFQQRITDTCDYLGLLWHHETDSRRSKAGFPDLVIVGPSGTIFAELKSDKGQITDAQWFWIRAINDSGSEAWIWRPRNWEMILGRLQALSRPKSSTLPV